LPERSTSRMADGMSRDDVIRFTRLSQFRINAAFV
jgi:hypothetical protein